MEPIINDHIPLFDAQERPNTLAQRKHIWIGIIVSIMLHSGLLVVLNTFSSTPAPTLASKAPKMNATLITLPVKTLTDLPVNTINNINENSPANYKHSPSVAITNNPGSYEDNSPIASNTNPIEPTEEMQAQTRIQFQQTQRQAITQYFNQQTGDKLNELNQRQATAFAREQISPKLFQGNAPLSIKRQDEKLIYDAKIDVDCAKGINQVLATISMFTLNAVVCQQNGDIDPFIQKRLQKMSSQDRSKSLIPPSRRPPE